MERNKAQTQTLEMDTRNMPADMLVHRDIPIQHWSWGQIQQSLYTVEQGRFQQQADAVIAYLQRLEATGQSVRNALLFLVASNGDIDLNFRCTVKQTSQNGARSCVEEEFALQTAIAGRGRSASQANEG